MDAYLVQHGEAKLETEDPERPLTNRGRDEVSHVAIYAANAGLVISRILHSGKLRARQTAEIFAQHLHPASGVAEVKGLSPLDEPRMAVSILEESAESVMLIGHLPHLSRLASSLILGDSSRDLIRFRFGGIVCLSKSEGKWMICWILTPELAISP